MREIVIFDTRESLLDSVASDVITFGFLALCIWFSHDMGGGWWTFFTCSMFLLMLAAKLAKLSTRQVVLKSKAEAIAWANALPEKVE